MCLNGSLTSPMRLLQSEKIVVEKVKVILRMLTMTIHVARISCLKHIPSPTKVNEKDVDHA